MRSSGTIAPISCLNLVYRPSFTRIPSALEYVKLGAACTGYTVPPTVYGGSVLLDADVAAAAGIAARCRRAPLSCRFTVAVVVAFFFIFPALDADPAADDELLLSYRRNTIDDDPPLRPATAHLDADADVTVVVVAAAPVTSAIARVASRTNARLAALRRIVRKLRVVVVVAQCG